MHLKDLLHVVQYTVYILYAVYEVNILCTLYIYLLVITLCGIDGIWYHTILYYTYLYRYLPWVGSAYVLLHCTPCMLLSMQCIYGIPCSGAYSVWNYVYVIQFTLHRDTHSHSGRTGDGRRARSFHFLLTELLLLLTLLLLTPLMLLFKLILVAEEEVATVVCGSLLPLVFFA